MKSLLFRIQSSVWVQVQLTRLRKLRDQWVDLPAQRLERARRALLAGDVDLLILGDSSTLCWSFHDTDRTLLPELLNERLGPRTVTVSGPGYGARLQTEMLRILATLPQRPKALVISLPIRSNSGVHIVRNPLTSYEHSRRRLQRVKHARRRITSFGRGGGKVDPRAMQEFLATPIRNRWGTLETINDYRSPISGIGLPPWPVELERIRFEFFHGEFIEPDDPQLPLLTELGRRIDEYGVPTVVYWTRPPQQRGEMHFPGEFEDHVREQLAVVEGALMKECTSIPGMLRLELDDEDYEDSRNATEHYRHSGRVKFADAIAAEIRRLQAAAEAAPRTTITEEQR